jgi:hypothetical protein
MSEATIVTHAIALLKERDIRIGILEAQLEAARSLTTSLEEEAHACPNQAHHRGWWTDPSEGL